MLTVRWACSEGCPPILVRVPLVARPDGQEDIDGPALTTAIRAHLLGSHRG